MNFNLAWILKDFLFPRNTETFLSPFYLAYYCYYYYCVLLPLCPLLQQVRELQLNLFVPVVH